MLSLIVELVGLDFYINATIFFVLPNQHAQPCPTKILGLELSAYCEVITLHMGVRLEPSYEKNN